MQEIIFEVQTKAAATPIQQEGYPIAYEVAYPEGWIEGYPIAYEVAYPEG